MPKRSLRKFLPTPARLRDVKGLGMFRDLFDRHELWHISRTSIARATAIGLFCSMFLSGKPFLADAENLRAIIIEKTGSRRDIPVSIVADGDGRHAMVVMSMDSVSQLRFKRLSISTQRPAAGE